MVVNGKNLADYFKLGFINLNQLRMVNTKY